MIHRLNRLLHRSESGEAGAPYVPSGEPAASDSASGNSLLYGWSHGESGADGVRITGSGQGCDPHGKPAG